MVCFCVLRPGEAPSAELRAELKALVAERLGKPLRPQAVDLVVRPAEDAQREGHAPRDPGGVPRRNPGDLSSLENPRGGGGDCQHPDCRS